MTPKASWNAAQLVAPLVTRIRSSRLVRRLSRTSLTLFLGGTLLSASACVSQNNSGVQYAHAQNPVPSFRGSPLHSSILQASHAVPATKKSQGDGIVVVRSRNGQREQAGRRELALSAEIIPVAAQQRKALM